MSTTLSPKNHSDLLLKAQQCISAGHLADAEQLLRPLAKRSPQAPAALNLLASIEVRRGQPTKAEQFLRKCLKLDKKNLPARINLGSILLQQDKPSAAHTYFGDVVRDAPEHAVARFNLGCCQRRLGQTEAAIASFKRAIDLQPDLVPPAINLGAVLCELGRYSEAEAVYLALQHRLPNLTEVQLYLGKVAHLQNRRAQAKSYFEAILNSPSVAVGARLSLASVLLDERDLDAAERLISEAASMRSASPTEIAQARAHLLAARGKYTAAIAQLSEAIAAGADQPQHYLSIANWHIRLQNRAKAIETIERSLSRFGERPAAMLPTLVVCQRFLCDWRHSEQRLEGLLDQLRSSNPPPIAPFAALTLPGLSDEELLRVTRRHAVSLSVESEPRPSTQQAPTSSTPRRLRIGYLSSDLHAHATAYLTAAMFEAHDRSQIETYAYSYGPDDKSPTRQRMQNAFEHFRDITALSHADAARRIQEDGIDILIDLKGYTRDARPEILARRPAPIQVNWLGYPGTMAADFMDYLIADETLIPPARAQAYSEALAYLPDTYAPMDPTRPVSASTRAAHGLPEDAFVFCCFNNPRKITPEFFSHWCDLLREIPDSVLWLYASQSEVIGNLEREAGARGVPSGRLIFAQHVSHQEHLGRLALADLVLDTLPYNAHTTAADALAVGVPVLTCLGSTFQGRVAASLLRAAGVPELIQTSIDAYVREARRLASDPAALGVLRQKLADARGKAPYFQPRRFAGNLETLYTRMWSRYLAGDPPGMLRVSD